MPGWQYCGNACQIRRSHLAVPNVLVPPGVGQEDPLEHELVLLRLLAAEQAATGAVKVLERDIGSCLFLPDGC